MLFVRLIFDLIADGSSDSDAADSDSQRILTPYGL